MATKKEKTAVAKPEETKPMAKEPIVVAPDDLDNQQLAKALRVTCAVDGFWRAGRQWTKEPIVVALDDLDNEQLALITGEAKLAVEHTEIEAPAGK